MYDVLLTCKPEELYRHTEAFAAQLASAEDAEALIRALWKRAPELTDAQEKELHRLGRAIRKKFHMKPVRL